ncbi:four helix bundle protein [bacterium]|nr:four helix bundle protein [bacterium]
MARIMNYRDLEVYRLSHELAVEIHRMTLSELPRYEQFEEASQIRRSAKSISVNIVEGFGRRRFKAEYVRFLIFSHASCDETIEHLSLLKDTNSLKKERAEYFLSKYDVLGRKISRFIDGVEISHRSQD